MSILQDMLIKSEEIIEKMKPQGKIVFLPRGTMRFVCQNKDKHIGPNGKPMKFGLCFVNERDFEIVCECSLIYRRSQT